MELCTATYNEVVRGCVTFDMFIPFGRERDRLRHVKATADGVAIPLFSCEIT